MATKVYLDVRISTNALVDAETGMAVVTRLRGESAHYAWLDKHHDYILIDGPIKKPTAKRCGCNEKRLCGMHRGAAYRRQADKHSRPNKHGTLTLATEKDFDAGWDKPKGGN
jgi:hypothetical protein